MSRRYGNPDYSRLHATDVFDGILLVDKPPGPTSHDIVAHIRRRFRFDKVGHGGTLDPQATGLLVILIGRGTKLSNLVMNSDKAYEGFLRLGLVTDSQDMAGKVISEADWSDVTHDRLEAEVAHYRGDVQQIPPMVSAVKKQGTALYKLARKGKSVERDPKLVHIYSFQIETFDPPRARFSVSCSKGTYVRTLCHDVGQALGCGAVLDELRRVRSGEWKVEDAITLDAIDEMGKDDLLKRIIPIHKVTAR